MAHAHAQSHDPSHHTTDSFRVAFFLNPGFTLFEIVGGVYTNSLAIPQVESIHHTYIWSLDGEHHVLTTHLVVEPEHATIELEFDEDCSMNGVRGNG